MKDNKEKCPNCRVNLQGEPIHREQQQTYGTTHFTRKVGIYDWKEDRTVKWKCPDCEFEWRR